MKGGDACVNDLARACARTHARVHARVRESAACKAMSRIQTVSGASASSDEGVGPAFPSGVMRHVVMTFVACLYEVVYHGDVSCRLYLVCTRLRTVVYRRTLLLVSCLCQVVYHSVSTYPVACISFVPGYVLVCVEVSCCQHLDCGMG